MTERVLFCGDSVSTFENEIIKLMPAIKGGQGVRFADGEASFQVSHEIDQETAIVLQAIVSDQALMSLLVMIDGLKRYGVKNIIGVITYFGYARQDRKTHKCSPISARLLANLLETAGLSRLIALDLHSELIEGFFNIPVTNVLPTELFASDIKENYYSLNDVIIVAPDIGATRRARNLANHLGKNNIAIIDKYRPDVGKSEVMNIIGEVENKNCIITDDIVDSGGTLCKAADALKERGAKSIDAYITHGVLTGRESNHAIMKINESKLNKVVLTNSVNYPSGINMVYHSSSQETLCEKIRVISMAEIVVKEIQRII